MKKLVFAIFALVFLWQVYRAATVPVSVDEAITYNQFASQSLSKLFTSPYHPANQILHSLACQLVLRVMRVTEFSLRLASLLGLLLYFWAAFRLVPLTNWSAAITLIVFAANPFSVGWLPESTGIWTGAAFCFLGLRELIAFEGQSWRLARASIFLGLSIGFQLSYLFLCVILLSFFVSFEYWEARRIKFFSTLNNLFLPAILLTFAIWILTLVRAAPTKLEWNWIVLLPGLLAFTIRAWSHRDPSWKLCGSTILVLTTFTLTAGSIPARFSIGPASALPRIARSIRNEIRRRPIRLTRVVASPSLVEPLEFYRRRYALGAVPKIAAVGSVQDPDYSVILDNHNGQVQLISRNNR